jgi:hypothetical protein
VAPSAAGTCWPHHHWGWCCSGEFLLGQADAAGRALWVSCACRALPARYAGLLLLVAEQVAGLAAEGLAEGG